jgi:predicted CoA-binding protein
MSSCEIPQSNPQPKEIEKLLKTAKTIAVVGLSAEPEKESYIVAAYLQSQGYKIVPVTPKYPEILGVKAYASLKDIPHEIDIDIVDVFRKPEAIPEVTDATLAMAKKPRAFWMQLGIAHNESAHKLQKAGILVVQSQCIKIVHQQIN